MLPRIMEDNDHFAVVAAALEVMPDISEQDLYDIHGEYFFVVCAQEWL